MSEWWSQEKEDIEKEMVKLRENFNARELLTIADDSFAVGDLLAATNGRSIHRVEKRTPKTVTLSTAFAPPDQANTCLAKDFVWTKNKQYRSASFDMEFKKTSEKEIDKVTELSRRIKAIRRDLTK